MATDLFHGPELDAAVEAAVGGPEAMRVCLTALDSRTQWLIDGQIEEGLKTDETRAALIEAGMPEGQITDDLVAIIGVRTAIGGAFSFGIHVGLELERQRARKEVDRAD